MQKSKIVFSATELQLVLDTGWILTKNGIIDKIYVLYGALGESLKQSYSGTNIDLIKVLQIHPKISKGENYKGLPWVMLDYPRYFKDDPGHFALRIFFWWGNYFLVQAQFSNDFIPKIVNGIRDRVIPNDINGYQLYVGYPINVWDNTLPQIGLNPLKNNCFDEALSLNSIFKIAIKVPIEDWEAVYDVSISLAEKIVKIFSKP